MSGGSTKRPYVGRFAPSPTGPLHFGSLLAALGSYLQARVHQGKWLLRIEDIDPPREIPGSADAILRALAAFGLEWDDTVLYQSSRLDCYAAAIQQLLDSGAAFRCRCTRRQVARHPRSIYSGLCRDADVPAAEEHSVRLRTSRQPVRFNDIVQGEVSQDLQRDVGDYVIKRRDGLFAYQLAVTLDDDFQGVTEVVRGCDLLGSTTRQIYLRDRLERPQPAYGHLPVALARTGQKLSKQTGAAALSVRNRSVILFDALRALCQTPPRELRGAPVEDQITWAIKNWNIKNLQGISSVELDDERNVVRQHSGPVPAQQFERE